MRRDGNKDWGVGVRVACVLACLGVLAAGGADAGDYIFASRVKSASGGTRA